MDGAFGSVTKGAVVGPQTGGALGIWGSGGGEPAAVAGPAPAGAPSGSCGVSATLRMGSRGEAVRCVQSTLNAQGFN